MRSQDANDAATPTSQAYHAVQGPGPGSRVEGWCVRAVRMRSASLEKSKSAWGVAPSEGLEVLYYGMCPSPSPKPKPKPNEIERSHVFVRLYFRDVFCFVFVFV